MLLFSSAFLGEKIASRGKRWFRQSLPNCPADGQVGNSVFSYRSLKEMCLPKGGTWGTTGRRGYLEEQAMGWF